MFVVIFQLRVCWQCCFYTGCVSGTVSILYVHKVQHAPIQVFTRHILLTFSILLNEIMPLRIYLGLSRWCQVWSGFGVSLTVQGLLRQDSRIQDLYFNLFKMKLPITLLYILSDAPMYDIIWTENSYVIDSFISEILKYKSWILASWRKRSWTVRFTPNNVRSEYTTLLTR